MKSVERQRVPGEGWFLTAATLVLVVAAGIRLFMLQDVPPGLSQDEVLNADIAELIRQGQNALFFREGFGHEPMYHYLAAPFRPLLGDNFLAIRLPSVYLGLLLVALTMGWVRRDFGPVAGLVTGAGLAISWWPVVFSRIGLRPILEPLLLVLAAWFWRRRPWLAGLFLGLSMYSYTAARAMFLLPAGLALYLLIFGRKHQDFREELKSSLVVLVAGLVISMPLFLTLWADPSLQQRVDQLGDPLSELLNGQVGPVLRLSVATLGVFSVKGDPRWTYSIPGRPFFDPLTAMFFFGGFILSVSRWRQTNYVFVLLWLLVGVLPSAITPQAPSTIRIIGALPIVYLFPGLAISWLYKRAYPAFGRSVRTRLHPGIVRVGLIAVLVGLVALNLGLTIRDGFVRWPAELETRFKYQTVLLDIARRWQEHPFGSPVIADGFYEPIDHDSIRRDFGNNLPVRWVQNGGAVVFPEEGSGFLFVPEYAPLEQELSTLAGLKTEPDYRSPGQPSFAVYELPNEPILPTLPDPPTFDDLITLLGYSLLPARADGSFPLITYWQVEDMLPADLAIFAHLLGSEGELVSQHDTLDAAAAHLRAGDRFLQLHILPPPSEDARAPGSLSLGLYTRGDDRRLTWAGIPGDQIILVSDLDFDKK